MTRRTDATWYAVMGDFDEVLSVHRTPSDAVRVARPGDEIAAVTVRRHKRGTWFAVTCGRTITSVWPTLSDAARMVREGENFARVKIVLDSRNASV